MHCILEGYQKKTLQSEARWLSVVKDHGDSMSHLEVEI
jgi:hypothetical protein